VKAKIFFITLAVDDLDRSVAFYRDGLGWPTEGIVGQEFHDEVTGADGTIAFFKLDGGLLLGLYERTNLAKDARLPPGPPSSTEFSLGIPAATQAEVDELLGQVEAAGGTLTAPPHMRPFGVYSGYFADPDGHLFEIACDSNGSLRSHLCTRLAIRGSGSSCRREPGPASSATPPRTAGRS
jgi:catechol 2,3-dioxygenase-like lactoylglutathione lyase family enzyme